MSFHKRRGVLKSANLPDETDWLALTDGNKLGDSIDEAVSLGLIVLVEAGEFFKVKWSVLEVYIVSSTKGALMFPSRRFEIPNRYNEYHELWREFSQRIYVIFFRSTVAPWYLLAVSVVSNCHVLIFVLISTFPPWLQLVKVDTVDSRYNEPPFS